MNTDLLFGILMFLTGVNGVNLQNEQDMNFNTHRIKMVEEQISARGISNFDVLRAMEKVERHLFVPDHLQKYAYLDRPLPIGHEQTISQPYIVGLMSQLIDVDKTEKVLEIGTGSGYQAAVLGELCSEVYSIEIIKPLQKRASFLIDSLNYKNIWVKHGDGYLGWSEKAPFDAIIVTCSPSSIPQPLLDQLAEGGRLVIPVGFKNVKKLMLLIKTNGKIKKQSVIPVRFVPMVDDKGNTY